MLSQSRPAYDLAVPHRVLSLLLSFHRSGFCLYLSISCMATNVRPVVVLFYNLALLVLRLILFPSVLCRTTAPTEHHLYLLVPVSGSHLVSTFFYYHRPVFVFSLVLSCSRFYRMCILLFLFLSFLTPSVVYIFYPTLFPSLCLYSPLTFATP